MNCKTCNFVLLEGQTQCPVCGTSVTNNVEETLSNEVVTPVNEPVVSEPVVTQVVEPAVQEVVVENVDPIGNMFPADEPVSEPVVSEIPVLNVEEPVTPAVEPAVQEVVLENVSSTGNMFPAEEIVSEPVVLDSPVMDPQEPAVEEVQVLSTEEPLVQEIPVIDNSPQAITEEPVMTASDNVFGFTQTNTPTPQPVASEPVLSQPEVVVSQPIPIPVETTPAFESPKAAKGNNIILSIIFGVLIVIGAAFAGFFGFKYFFNQNQVAPYKGYNYKISGKYNAKLVNNEKIVIEDKKENVSWTITMSSYDLYTKVEEVKNNQDLVKNDLTKDGYTVDKSEYKTIKGREMLVNEVTKDNKKSYVVIVANPDGFVLESSLSTKDGKLSPNVLDVLADVVNSAEKIK